MSRTNSSALLAVLVVATALPWSGVRALVLAASVVLVLATETRADSTLKTLRLPVGATLLVSVVTLSVFWAPNVAVSALEAAQIGTTFLLACYLTHNRSLPSLHSSLALGLRVLMAINLAVEIFADITDISLFDVDPWQGHQGIMANPNLLAFVAVLGAISMTALPRNAFRWRASRFIWILIALWQVWGSKADAAVVYLAAGMIFTLILHLARRGDRRLVLLAALGASTPAALLLLQEAQSALFRLFGITSNITLSGRTYIWDVSVEAITESPLLGFGIGGLRSIENAPTARMAAVWNQLGLETFNAHNGYIETALQVGVPAALLAAAILVTCLFSYMAAIRREPGAVWAAALTGTIILYNLSESRLLSFTNSWFIVALLTSAATSIRASRRQPPPSPLGRSRNQGHSATPRNSLNG